MAKSLVIDPFSTQLIQTNSKDFENLISSSSNYLTTNQFLDELDGQLKKKLN